MKYTVVAGFSALLFSIVALGSSAGEAQQASGFPPVERTAGGEAVGASIAHPAGWRVEREPYTFEGTYGFSLWRPATDAAHDHGAVPAVRVALAYGLRPDQVEQTVNDKIAAYPDLPLAREEVWVAEEGHEGVAVGPIPGSTPSTEVYVPVNGRVYLIDVYGDELGAEGKDLLSALRFEPPTRSVSSLGLPSANSPKALYAPADLEVEEGELAAREAFTEPTEEAPDAARADLEPATRSGSGETKLSEGCWRANDGFYVQTQHGRYANRRSGDGIPKGMALVGRPNYWNEYTHGSLGYGRCTSNYYTNDKFAVDYRLQRGDYLFSPVESGTVKFAGRSKTHKDYGIFVVIKASNGKYVSLSGHLSGLRRGLNRGDRVTNRSVIGYAGDSGGGSITVGPVHLHQAFYRYPSYLRDGSPYGGAGLQVVRHHYVRGDGGVYKFGWRKKPGVKSKGSLVEN
ncbi:MAG: M23 family metallopeptidase [Rubrobacter sp.]|nr:M23 family metallopeptidase [Rubrobacteraceae bacterium]MBA3795411.1 M23 family metallopeptidase [Rubrobacter sp.]